MLDRDTKIVIKYAMIYACVVSFFTGVSLLELAFIQETAVVVPMVLVNILLMLAIGCWLVYSRWYRE